VGRDVKGQLGESGNLANAPEVEAALETMPVDVQSPGTVDVVIAVDVTQVGQVNGVLSSLLGMTGETERRELVVAPAGLFQRLKG
jgi:hypothetical protein